MMHSLYTGATGLKTHSEGLSVVANNLANVNTIGYKQQSTLFQDLMSQDLVSPMAPSIALSQLGMGAWVGDVRTLFTQGAFETGSSLTDLALSGKGFFQVVSDTGVQHYTRAGNFRFDVDGYLRDPAGYTLSGIKMVNGQKSGTPVPIQVNMNDPSITTVPAKATSQITAVMNIGSSADRSSSESDPYSSLRESWNGLSNPPLTEDQYSAAQDLTIYDANGTAHTVRMYIDGAPTVTQGMTTYEYVLGVNPSEDGSSAAGTAGAGLLTAGTLTFNSKGELVDMPPLQFTASFTGSAPQNITLNLAGTTARSGASALYSSKQDGYAKGNIIGLNITENGIVEAQYSNNTTTSLYSIPVFRFTSEDGLRNEGMNHYSATKDSGPAEYGDAGTSNYGTIIANQLETSNVDISREMVTMITVQRGFQMNSKVITTADTMLQRALELKR